MIKKYLNKLRDSRAAQQPALPEVRLPFASFTAEVERLEAESWDSTLPPSDAEAFEAERAALAATPSRAARITTQLRPKTAKDAALKAIENVRMGHLNIYEIARRDASAENYAYVRTYIPICIDGIFDTTIKPQADACLEQLKRMEKDKSVAKPPNHILYKDFPFDDLFAAAKQAILVWQAEQQPRRAPQQQGTRTTSAEHSQLGGR